MSCREPRFREALEALAAGELSTSEFAALRTHATHCEGCRVQYERVSRLERHLERKALPQRHQELLEAELFARLRVDVPPPQTAQVIRPSRWSPRRVAAVALPIAASILAGVLLVPAVLREDTFQARAGGPASVFGVRAFCLNPAGEVIAEAGGGETLRCAPGGYLQFSQTSPVEARLAIQGRAEEPLTFFPLDGQSAHVPRGIDVPLSHSTPVTAEWLRGPITIIATFRSKHGEVVGTSELKVVP